METDENDMHFCHEIFLNQKQKEKRNAHEQKRMYVLFKEMMPETIVLLLSFSLVSEVEVYFYGRDQSLMMTISKR